MTVTDLIPDDERTVFLSIRPEHCRAILDGRKQYEFRRTPPAIDPPYTALLYATGDQQNVPGLIHVSDHIQNTAPEVARATQTGVPQSAGDIARYLDGGMKPTAMQIGTKAEFDPAIPREELIEGWEPGFAPQNFRYVDCDPLLDQARHRVVKLLGGTTRRCRTYHTDRHCYRLNRKDRDPHIPTESEIQFHDIEHCPNCNPKDTENNEGETDDGPLARVVTPEEAD